MAAAREVDFDFDEHWDGRITDDLVNGLGAFTGGVAEFKEAYVRCQAHHVAVLAGEETLREWIEFYRDKAQRFEPDAPLPDLPAGGGDLVGDFSESARIVLSLYDDPDWEGSVVRQPVALMFF